MRNRKLVEVGDLFDNNLKAIQADKIPYTLQISQVKALHIRVNRDEFK